MMSSYKTILPFIIFFSLFAATGVKAQDRKLKTYGSNLHVKAPKQKKEQLSQKTHEWIQETLDKKQFSPLNIDVEHGVFQGMGALIDSGGIVQYEMAFFARNNGVQLVFDANYHRQNPETKVKVNDNYLRRKTQNHFQNLARDLEKYLNRNDE